jgi:hypothetical protein
MAATLKLGDKIWATKEGSLLAYNDENNNIKPLPFDFTRASSATRVNKQGLIETVASGVPRIDFTDANGALLLEPQRTNVLFYSNDFSNIFNWINSGVTITNNSIISPDGSQNATKLTISSGQYLYQNIGVTASNNYTISIYVKVLSGTKQFKFNVYGGGNSFTSSAYTATTTWQRFNYTFTATATGSTGIYPILVDGLTGGDFYIYGAQLEQGSYATSYIPTYGTSQTRSEDHLGNILLPEFDDENNYSVMFDLTRKGVDTSLVGEFFEFRRTDFARMIRFWIDAPSAQVRFRSDQESNATMSTIAFSADATKKICVVYDGDTFKTFTDGALVGTYSVVNAMPLSRFYMTSKSFDMNQLVVFKTSLTDSEAIALTTI